MATDAAQEAGAEHAFKLAQPLAHSGRGDAELVRGTGEAAGGAHDVEDLDGAQRQRHVEPLLLKPSSTIALNYSFVDGEGLHQGQADKTSSSGRKRCERSRAPCCCRAAAAVQAISAAGFLYLAWTGLTILEVTADELLPVTGIATSWSCLSIVVGFTLLAVTALTTLPRLLAAGADPLRPHQPPAELEESIA